MTDTKPQIYKIIDSFLTEARDQNGKDRSLQRLNADRHLAAEAFLKLISSRFIEKEKVREAIMKYQNDEDYYLEDQLSELGLDK